MGTEPLQGDASLRAALGEAELRLAECRAELGATCDAALTVSGTLAERDRQLDDANATIERQRELLRQFGDDDNAAGRLLDQLFSANKRIDSATARAEQLEAALRDIRHRTFAWRNFVQSVLRIIDGIPSAPPAPATEPDRSPPVPSPEDVAASLDHGVRLRDSETAASQGRASPWAVDRSPPEQPDIEAWVDEHREYLDAAFERFLNRRVVTDQKTGEVSLAPEQDRAEGECEHCGELPCCHTPAEPELPVYMKAAGYEIHTSTTADKPFCATKRGGPHLEWSEDYRRTQAEAIADVVADYRLHHDPPGYRIYEWTTDPSCWTWQRGGVAHKSDFNSPRKAREDEWRHFDAAQAETSTRRDPDPAAETSLWDSHDKHGPPTDVVFVGSSEPPGAGSGGGGGAGPIGLPNPECPVSTMTGWDFVTRADLDAFRAEIVAALRAEGASWTGYESKLDGMALAQAMYGAADRLERAEKDRF